MPCFCNSIETRSVNQHKDYPARRYFFLESLSTCTNSLASLIVLFSREIQEMRTTSHMLKEKEPLLARYTNTYQINVYHLHLCVKEQILFKRVLKYDQNYERKDKDHYHSR